jgi:hypothetical protein
MNMIRLMLVILLLGVTLLLTGCSGNVGVGMSVGVPVGSNGYVRVGGSTNRWY